MKTTTKSTGIGAIASLALLLLTGPGCRSTTSPAAATEPELLKLSGDLSAHDPVIIKEKDTYYIFCTGGGRRGGIIPIRCSTNLLNWTRCGSVFEILPEWATNEITRARGAWAILFEEAGLKFENHPRARGLGAGHLPFQRKILSLLFPLQLWCK